MSRLYDTFSLKTQTFMSRHEPTEKSSHCCTSITPALLARFILRTIIPIAFGLGGGMLANWVERKIDFHNSDALIEVSDFVSSAITLLAAYTMNALLNCCWPINPYYPTDFFQHTASADHTEAALSQYSL